MGDDGLKETFKRAADIASVVPETMHGEAFTRALDVLLGADAHQGVSPTPRTKGNARKKEVSTTERGNAVTDPVEVFATLERSRASEVDDATGAQAKALAVLMVARREFDIDGLTATQISSIISGKFRSRVTRQGIATALDRAGKRVDHVKVGKGAARYRIMQAGEQWLADGAKDDDGSSAAPRKARSIRRAKPKADETGATNAVHQSKAKPSRNERSKAQAAKRTTIRSPKASVQALITNGWFTTPRQLGDIREELESSAALRFKPTELSPAMIRLLRDGLLRRSKNSSGQYEYTST